jgi:hypothetical protein
MEPETNIFDKTRTLDENKIINETRHKHISQNKDM